MALFCGGARTFKSPADARPPLGGAPTPGNNPATDRSRRGEPLLVARFPRQWQQQEPRTRRVETEAPAKSAVLDRCEEMNPGASRPPQEKILDDAVVQRMRARVAILIAKIGASAAGRGRRLVWEPFDGAGTAELTEKVPDLVTGVLGPKASLRFAVPPREALDDDGVAIERLVPA